MAAAMQIIPIIFRLVLMGGAFGLRRATLITGDTERHRVPIVMGFIASPFGGYQRRRL